MDSSTQQFAFVAHAMSFLNTEVLPGRVPLSLLKYCLILITYAAN